MGHVCHVCPNPMVYQLFIIVYNCLPSYPSVGLPLFSDTKDPSKAEAVPAVPCPFRAAAGGGWSWAQKVPGIHDAMGGG
jgi:hypothetical protein